jgi:hypothetical protein
VEGGHAGERHRHGRVPGGRGQRVELVHDARQSPKRQDVVRGQLLAAVALGADLPRRVGGGAQLLGREVERGVADGRCRPDRGA